MDYGQFIDNHLELICISYQNQLYISRRSIKHFVESRKKEMIDNHDDTEIFDKLYFAIDNIINTYVNNDENFIQENIRLAYIKYFTELRGSSLKIIFEKNNTKLEICSIHFKKYKKPSY